MILNWSDDGKYLTFFTPDLYIVDAESGEILLFLDANENLLYNNVVPAGSDFVFASQGGGEAILLSLPGIASVKVQENYEGDHAACVLKKVGAYLYTSERRANVITIFRTDGLKVERVAILDPIGVKPDDLSFSDGLVAVANETSNSLNFFTLREDGLLHPLPAQVDVPGPLCVLFG